MLLSVDCINIFHVIDGETGPQRLKVAFSMLQNRLMQSWEQHLLLRQPILHWDILSYRFMDQSLQGVATAASNQRSVHLCSIPVHQHIS